MLEGTRALLLQSGLPLEFWPEAAQAYCHASNIQMRDGTSPWMERHGGNPFLGKLIPFGAKIHYRPDNNERKHQHKYEPTSREGIFLGWVIHSGGVWRGE